MPNWTNPIMERLSVNMIRLHIPKFFHRLDKDDQMWWNRYLEDLETMKQVQFNILSNLLSYSVGSDHRAQFEGFFPKILSCTSY